MPHLVFVYGTLKRGFPNHRHLAGATFVGLAETVERYPLIIQGQFYSPVMIPEPGHGHRVAGEIWEVDDAKLADLDRLESVHLPTGYFRESIAVRLVETAQSSEDPRAGWHRAGGASSTRRATEGASVETATLQAEVYFKPRERIAIVHSEPLADYQDRRYVPADKRPR